MLFIPVLQKYISICVLQLLASNIALLESATSLIDTGEARGGKQKKKDQWVAKDCSTCLCRHAMIRTQGSLVHNQQFTLPKIYIIGGRSLPGSKMAATELSSGSPTVAKTES